MLKGWKGGNHDRDKGVFFFSGEAVMEGREKIEKRQI